MEVSAWKNVPRKAEDAVFSTTSTVLNLDVRAIGGNTEARGRDYQNFLVGGNGERRSQPPRTVRAYSVDSVSTATGGGRRINTTRLSDYGLYADAYWIGGTAELWSVTNGILSLYRTSEIIGAGTDHVDLADDGGSTDIQAGDMMIIRRLTDTPKQSHSAGPSNETKFIIYAPHTARQIGWHGDDADAPAQWKQDVDGWYVEYDIQTLNTSKHRLELAATGDDQQDFYYILQPGTTYRVEFTMWANANTTVELSYRSLQSHTVTAINGTPTTDTFPVTLNVTTSEQTLSVEFEVSSVATSVPVQALELIFQSTGKHYLRGPLKVWDTAADYGGLIPSEFTRFSDANLDFVRDHNIVKTDQPGAMYDLAALVHDYIHASLTNAVALGHTRFWLQPEYYIYDEAAELYEYLCGTADGSTPWADLRASLGRTAPWTDDLHILFEISNELWINTNRFQIMPGMVDRADGNFGRGELSGAFLQQQFIDVFKAQPGYSAANFTYICGGRFNSPFGDVAAMYAPDATLVVRAPYISGWEVGSGTPKFTPADFFHRLNWPATITKDRLEDSDGWITNAIAASFNYPLPAYSTGANANLKAGTYEDALGYSGVPAGEEEKRFYRTKVLATVWLDKLAHQARRYSVQSLFTMDRGDQWASHDRRSGRTWPFHMWNEVFNAHVANSEYREVTMSSGPTRTLDMEGRTADGDGPRTYTNVPEVGCYTFKTATGWTAIVTNRNLPYDSIDSADALYDPIDDGSRAVQVNVDSSSYTLRKFTMSGAWDAQNYDDTQATFNADMSIVETKLGINDGTVSEMIPAANAVVYVWEA